MNRLRPVILAQSGSTNEARSIKVQKREYHEVIVKRWRHTVRAVSVCLVCAAFLARADDGFSSGLVTVPVHVTGTHDAPLSGLTIQDFHLFEDGVEQKILSVSEHAPVSVALVVDASGSIAHRWHVFQEAIKTFLSTTGTGDELALITVSDKPHLATPLTVDAARIFREVTATRPLGRTALWDGIAMALDRMKSARNPAKALVVFTDGGENCSELSYREIRRRLLASDTELVIADWSGYQGGHLETPDSVEDLLQFLAGETGGQMWRGFTARDLLESAQVVGAELHSQYLLSYSPLNHAADKKYRHIKLQLTVPAERGKLKAAWRHGYYALTAR